MTLQHQVVNVRFTPRQAMNELHYLKPNITVNHVMLQNSTIASKNSRIN